MDELIRFTDLGADHNGVAKRHHAAALAMHRYVPHVIRWDCPQAGAPIHVTLPESLSAREVLHRAEHERVQLATIYDPTAPDRVFDIHYAHLGEAEIEEGIRRLGYCLVKYAQLAARTYPGQPSTLVGT